MLVRRVEAVAGVAPNCRRDARLLTVNGHRKKNKTDTKGRVGKMQLRIESG